MRITQTIKGKLSNNGVDQNLSGIQPRRPARTGTFAVHWHTWRNARRLGSNFSGSRTCKKYLFSQLVSGKRRRDALYQPEQILASTSSGPPRNSQRRACFASGGTQGSPQLAENSTWAPNRNGCINLCRPTFISTPDMVR